MLNERWIYLDQSTYHGRNELKKILMNTVGLQPNERLFAVTDRYNPEDITDTSESSETGIIRGNQGKPKPLKRKYNSYLTRQSEILRRSS